MATVLPPVNDTLAPDAPDVMTEEQDDVAEPTEQMEDGTFLMIPIRDEAGNESEKAIVIKLDELPDAASMLGVLQAEQADLSIWLNVSIEYYRQNLKKDFELFMTTATGDEMERHYIDDVAGRVALLNAFAAYCIKAGKKTVKDYKDKDKKPNEYLDMATKLLNRATACDKDNKFDEVWVTKAMFDLAHNDYDNALRKFDRALQINANNLAATLGLAKIYFYKTNYKKALDHYKTGKIQFN